MRQFYFLTVYSLLLGLTIIGCDEEYHSVPGNTCCSATGPVYVAKFNNEKYGEYYCAEMRYDNETGTEIVVNLPLPSEIGERKSRALGNGYYEVNYYCEAITDITYDAYVTTEELDADYVLGRVIDTSPFSEKYECCNLCVRTHPLEEIVADGRLEDCYRVE